MTTPTPTGQIDIVACSKILDRPLHDPNSANDPAEDAPSPAAHSRRIGPGLLHLSLERDHLITFGDQLGEAGVPLEFPHEFDAALLHLFLDTEGPRAIGTSALDLILHRLEMLVVLVLRIGEFADPLGLARSSRARGNRGSGRVRVAAL